MPPSLRLSPPIPFPTNVNTIPLEHISLAKLHTGNSQESLKLFEACKKTGFFMLDLQGPSDGEALLEDADKLLIMSEELFALDLKEKEKYAFTPGSIYGYKGMGMMKTDQKGTPDRCEFWGVSNDEVLGLSAPFPQPEVIERHKPLYTSFTKHAHEIGLLILAHINKHLQLPPGTLESLHRLSAPSGNQSRLLTFPAQSPSDRRTSLVPHTDFGSVTVLFNILGGLQILPPDAYSNANDDSAWRFVFPAPGCAIINIGDAMVKFTNGLLRSNMHRVTYPPGEQATLVRNSLAYFLRPEDEALLRRLEGSDVIPPLESGVVEEIMTSLEWIAMKGAALKNSGTIMASSGEKP